MARLFRCFTPTALIGAMALGLAFSANAAPSSDAVTYRTNPAHTAQATMPDFSLPLEKKWDVDLGVTAKYPLIAAGKVFVVLPSSSSSTTSGHHSALIAFDAATGHVAWGPIALPASTYGWAAACYDNGRIFINTDGSISPLGGLMAAYSAANGSLQWSSTLPVQYGFSSAPSALNGYVYTGGAGTGGTVYCVRESDGTVMWQGGVSGGDSSSPAVTPAKVYAGYACGQTFSFDALSGALAWHLSTGCAGGGGATSAFYNNLVFIRQYYAPNGPTWLSAALDSTTGNVVKVLPELGALAFDNNMVFGISNSALTAVKISDWTTAWTVNNAIDAPVTAPTVVNGVVYVGTTSGKLQGFNEQTAKLVASVDLGAAPSPTSESNVDMAAGNGIMVIPAGTHLIAVGSQFTLSSITATPQNAIGGANISVTVTLTSKAPVGGSVIALTSSDAHLVVPSSIAVPVGSLSVSFVAHTTKTNTGVQAKLAASFNGLTKEVPIGLLPDGLVSFTISPSSVAHGGVAKGILTLAYPAPVGGLNINLSSAFAPLAQPSVTHIVIPAGQSVGTFSIRTGAVLTAVPVNIGAQVAYSNTLIQAVTLTP
ncbi:MAG: PQQ-binding-like beta-propeller repeat protein [Capsulimonas sp.]|uniref:outer membrane protein assembly factor BamB family protein n=1 Tax=Capsulimonas sp. TaxID=2494211 RepID=UPI003263E1C2